MTETLTESSLAYLVNQVWEEYPGALSDAQKVSASEKLASLILEDPAAHSLVAQLARHEFMTRRRGPHHGIEKDAKKDWDAQREADHQREQQSRPRWTGDDRPSGRRRPRPEGARDDAAQARQLAFLNTPIEIPGLGEVLWGDATAPNLRARRKYYEQVIKGMRDSVSVLDEQIDIIEDLDGSGTLTLREAYQQKGLI